MTLTSKFSLVIRCALPLVSGLSLTDCYVSGAAQARPSGQITVQPASGSYSTQVQAQPTYQTQVYAQPQPVQTTVYAPPQPVAPPPVVQGNVGVGFGGMSAGAGMAVGAGWVTDGYQQQDFVSYNMSMRARQFAAGYVPVTQLFRASMGQGQHQFVTVTAAQGRCYRIIGVGGPGVQDLDLRLRDMSGNVIDQDVATDNFPVLGLNRPLCLNWTGTFQVEIIMYAGGGDIGVQAFAQ